MKSLDGETRVIMEHTGRYYEPMAQFLYDDGLYVSAVNPKLIKDYGNNSLRKVKTDRANAKKIANYGLDNWVELRQHTPMDKIRYQLKTLNRQYNLYSKSKTMMKNNLIALLDQPYPGVNAPFDSPVREDVTQKWVDFAVSFWHLDCVRSICLTAFTERYRKWCKRNKYNFSNDKAAEIHAGAQDQIAMLPKDASTKLMVQQAINALNAVSATLERLKAEALEFCLPAPLISGGHGNARCGRFPGFSTHGGDWGCDSLLPKKFHHLYYNRFTVRGTAASRVSFRIVAKAVRMGGDWPDDYLQGLIRPKGSLSASLSFAAFD